jgi:hypothetical protein
MSSQITKKVPFQPFTFTVSGTTYNQADLKNFRIKPLKSRKVGAFGGVQYTYRVDNRADQIEFQDLICEAAEKLAEEVGAEHHSYLAMVKDAGHLFD